MCTAAIFQNTIIVRVGGVAADAVALYSVTRLLHASTTLACTAHVIQAWLDSQAHISCDAVSSTAMSQSEVAW